MATFAQLRGQLRGLESKLSSGLSDYSAVIAAVTPSPGASEAALTAEIQSSLNECQQVVDSLVRIVDSDTTASTTKLHQVQRHKEVLGENKTEFKRIKTAIDQERNRRNLLSSVRSDIATHRARSVTPGQEADYMLEERSRIDNSHNLADSLLSQAYETRDEFIRQRASLGSIQRRIFQTASHIPGLNTIISKVNTRKKRDSIILATLISVCILFIFFVR